MIISPGSLEEHRNHVRASYLALCRTPRTDLRWITVIIGAYVVGIEDDIRARICDDIEEYQIRRREVMMGSGTISRSAKEGQTRWSGTIEIDLLHPRLLLSPMKTALMGEFGIDANAVRLDQRIVVLHEHAVYDCRGHTSLDRLAQSLRKEWPGLRRVFSAKIYDDEENLSAHLERLAGYSTKRVHRYSSSWCGQKTSYHADYESQWRKYVCSIYDAVGYMGLHDANVKSQVGKKKSGMYARRKSDRSQTNTFVTKRCASEESSNLKNTLEEPILVRNAVKTSESPEFFRDRRLAGSAKFWIRAHPSPGLLPRPVVVVVEDLDETQSKVLKSLTDCVETFTDDTKT